MKKGNLKVVISLINVLAFSSEVLADLVPHDEPYYKYKEDNVEIIYSEDNLPYAKQTAAVEKGLNKSYENSFDWKFDETLYVGLISCNNQIANGFSTQWPNNRQINYIGGGMMVDYFSSTSWLHTLLYHETAHNYQVNVKGSGVSRALHSVFGNGDFFIFVPFIIPNVMENSFMLEGNAVLNESWHGNGGRLYSGRFKAQTILQAKAGNIIASDVYNSKLAFPYGEIVYIQGGFFNLFLAEKYGLDKVNNYFKKHSEDFWWPQFTNASLEELVGVDFEDSLEEFAEHYKGLSKEFIQVEGKTIAKSQFFSSLSSSENEIFFITNESGVDTPKLITLDKKSLETKTIKDSWFQAKVIKVNDEYYTHGSRYTSPIKIEQGLFDSNGFLKEETGSKVVQGYLSDSRDVYFDVNRSFDEPKLYVGDKFYEQVNSSVFIDKSDNLYYFKQDKKKRTLYKNKTPLYSYNGFYGLVSDVDTQGNIYFVANSELGSTLYRFRNGEVTRVSKADNIIEAKLVDDTQLLIAAISDKEYYYTLNAIDEIKQEPYETKLFFEDKEYYGAFNNSKSVHEEYEHVDLSNDYYSFLDMHYSGASINFGISADNDFFGNLSLTFSDPLAQNSTNIFVNRDESNTTIAGIGYSNTQYLLNYSLRAYGVIDSDELEETRDYGLIFSSSLPFYRSGYLYGAVGLNYFQDYEALTREPLSMTLTFMEQQQYGVSMYANYLNYIQLYGVSDRGDSTIGANYKFMHDIINEAYFSLEAKYSYTYAPNALESKGVKLTNATFDAMDPSAIHMPSYNGSAYVKQAGYIDVGLQKVFNFSSYFFTFPISLQRESIYTNYKYYELEGFSTQRYNANEVRVGVTLSTVILNSLPLPISIEYIYNDAEFIEDEHDYRFLMGISF